MPTLAAPDRRTLDADSIPDDCPACDATVVNVQGRFACADCVWAR